MQSVKRIGKLAVAMILVAAVCIGICAGLTIAAEMTSSDLSDFTSSAVIEDSAGGTIGNGDLLHVGSSYKVELSFAESNYTGSEKQFKAGQLTYQLPGQIVVNAVSNKDITLSDDTTIVAHYSITSGGYITVDFVQNNGKYYFEDYNNTSFSLKFDCTIAANGGEGAKVLDFGNGKTLNVNITSDGDLKVEKNAGDYNGATGMIEYSVKVTAVNGTVSGIQVIDTITSGNAQIVGTGSYYKLDGTTALGAQPATLAADEGFIWKYQVKVNNGVIDTTQKDGRATINNQVTVSGTTNGKSISKSATKTTHINYTNFKKEAVSIDTATQTIVWKLQLGDGNIPLSSVFGNIAQITEALSDAGLYSQKFDPQTVNVKYEDAAGVQSNASVSWNGTGTLNIPTGNAYKAEFELTSTYVEKISLKVGPANFINTATIVTAGGTVSDGSTISKGVDGVADPVIKKKITKDTTNNSLHYTITAEIPGGYENVPGFYLVDAISSIGTTTFSNDPVNMNISAVPAAGGSKVQFTQDDTHSVPNTYSIVKSGGKNEVLTIYFNAAPGDKDNSVWTFDKDMVLTVEYDLPLNTTSGGESVQAALSKGGVLKNTVQLDYNNGEKIETDDSYSEVSEFEKSGTYDSNTDTIDYTCTFYNVFQGTQALTTLTADEFIFTDTLGGGMTFAEDSLYVEFYDGNDVKAAYKYTKKIGGQTRITANSADFQPMGNTTTTLFDFFTQNYNIRYIDRIVYHYKVEVDRESSVFTCSGNDVDLSNTAGLSFLNNGDNKKVLPNTTAYVKVPDNKVNKFLSGLHDTNRVSFTIELNYAGEDLITGVDTLTVTDTLSSNITPILNTVDVQIKKNGAWTPYTGGYKYDNKNNVQEFTVPDATPVKITYDVKINVTGNNITISNDVKVKGNTDFVDRSRAVFDVQKSGASASASITNFNLYKYDSATNAALAKAVFAMYGPAFPQRQGDADADSVKYGATIPKTVKVTTNGTEKTLYYYRCYETDDIGVSEVSSINMSVGGLYSFKEVVAPKGYVMSQDLITIYAFEYPTTDQDLGIRVIQGDDNLFIANEAEKVPVKVVGGLKITKTIKGDATEGEAEGVLKFKVTGPGGFDKTYTLKEFNHSKNTKVYTLELKDLTPGSYTVEETAYKITGKTVTVKYSIDAGRAVEGTSVSVKVVKDETVDVAFEDNYLKQQETTTKKEETTTKKEETTKKAEPTTEKVTDKDKGGPENESKNETKEHAMTGDSENLTIWIIAFALACFTLAAAIFIRRRKTDK